MRRAVIAAFLLAAACEAPLPMDTRFGEPVRIATGVSGGWRPKLAVSENGDAMVLWQGMDAGDWSMWTVRYTSSGGWGAPEVIEQSGGLSQAPQLAIDGGGNAFAAWTQSPVVNTSELWTNRFVPVTGWGEAGSFLDGVGNPQLAMNRVGAAVLAWTTYAPDRRVFVARFDPASGWSPPETIDLAEGTPARGPLVAIDDAGNVVAAWEDDAFSQDTIDGAGKSFRGRRRMGHAIRGCPQ